MKANSVKRPLIWSLGTRYRHNTTGILSLIALAALAATSMCAVDSPPNAEGKTNVVPVVTIPLSSAGPKIDGGIVENEWVGPVLQGFYQPNVNLMDRRGGRFALACDGKSLYVTAETPVHPRYGPVARLLSMDPDDIALDDSLEIWLVPGLSGKANVAYQILFNTLGNYAHRQFLDPSPSINFATSGWDVKGLTQSSVIRDSKWTLATAIPLAALGLNAPGAGLRLRVCRNYKLPFIQARDNPGVVFYKDPATMMQVRFQEGAPVVVEPDWVGQKTDKAVVTLRNPTPVAMKVQVAGKLIELSPGAIQEAPIPIQAGAKNTRQAEVTVTMPDGTVIHHRTAKWLVTDEPIWEEVL